MEQDQSAIENGQNNNQLEFIKLLISQNLQIDSFFRSKNLPKKPFFASFDKNSTNGFDISNISNIPQNSLLLQETEEKNDSPLNLLKELQHLDTELDRNVKEYREIPKENDQIIEQNPIFNEKVKLFMDQIRRKVWHLIEDKRKKDVKFNEITNSLNERSNQLQKEKEKFLKDFNELKNQQKEYKEFNEELEKELIEKKNSLEDFKKKLEAEVAETQRLRLQIQEKENNFKELQEEFTKYKENKEAKVTELEDHLKLSKRKRKELKKEYHQFEEEKNNEISRMNQENHELSNKIHELEQNIVDLKGKNQMEINDLNETHRSEINKLQDLLTAQSEENSNNIENLKKKYESEINLLTEQNQSERNRIEENYQAEKESLQFLLEKEAQEHREKQEKLEKMETKLQKTRNQLKEAENSLVTTTDNLNKANQELNNLRTEHENLLKTNATTREKLDKLKKKHKDLEISHDKLNESHKTLISQHESLQDSHNFILERVKNHPINKKSKKNPYDIVLKIDSLQNNELGWEIVCGASTNLKEINQKNKEFTVIGFVGRENIGKTFVLNKLTGFELPSGTNVNTQGLSMKLADYFLCLDSAGLQVPVYYYDKTLMKHFKTDEESLVNNETIRHDMINDRTLTDMFVQDYILEVCQIIVIVVGTLSQNDQKFIERITSQYKYQKTIIILHNFSNIYLVEDVEKRVEKDILCAFQVTEAYIPNTDVKQYIEKPPKRKNVYGQEEQEVRTNIIHLVLGMDWGESGKFYNKATIEYIKKYIETNVEKSHYDLVKTMTRFFEENYRNYLKFKQIPTKPITMELDEKNSRLKVLSDTEFHVSNPAFNCLGSLMPPAFEIIEKDMAYICFVELPDIIFENVKVELNSKKEKIAVLSIKAEKNANAVALEENNQSVVGNRKIGAVLCKVPFGPRNMVKSIEKNSIVYEKGVLIVKVEKLPAEEEEIFENK